MRFRISCFVASSYDHLCVCVWRTRIILRPSNSDLPTSSGPHLSVLCLNPSFSSSASPRSAYCSGPDAAHVDAATTDVDGTSTSAATPVPGANVQR